MAVPGADRSGTGPFPTLAPAVTTGMGSWFGNPPASAGGTVLTAMFG
ncbi:hypothetical protein [Streptosporangium sp. NPDC048865]